jgi:glyoxylase I family protein
MLEGLRSLAVLARSPTFQRNAMEIIGLDHIYLTVSDFARSEAFYDRVLERLGFRKGDKRVGGDPHAHYFNRSLQLSIRPARSDAPHDPYAPGLHHLCLQMSTNDDVDAAAAAIRELGIEATEPAYYPEYNPDYYASFFEDPDGIRLELVCRSPARDAIVEHWDELRTFLNPMADLQSRKDQESGG